MSVTMLAHAAIAEKLIPPCASTVSKTDLSGRLIAHDLSQLWKPPSFSKLGNRFGLPEKSVQRCRVRRAGCAVHMSFNDGSMSEEFNESDPTFINTSVLDAVEVCSGKEGFTIKLSDGRRMRCVHNKADTDKLPTYASHPAMVLRMEDGSGILLPIVVLEQPCAALIETVHGGPTIRPTIYQVLRDMVELMGHEVKLVRITHRVCEAYHARIYLSKTGEDSDMVFSLDLRPSDAINLAARAKAPIQVNRMLALSDGVRAVSSPARVPPRTTRTSPVAFVISDVDRPNFEPCPTAEEFTLLKMLQAAAAEERYADAAKLRDELVKHRLARIKANKARKDKV